MQLISLLSGLATFACLANPAQSWQTEVHNQIGHMAEQFLHDNTRAMISRVLEPEYNGSIGRAAGWADTVRKTTHRYSYYWHFISALDSPPTSCGLYYNRDCQKEGCVVQQIANQTQILEGCMVKVRDGGDKASLPVSCSEALKWIAHFFGDVAQPLHTSERQIGGNTVKVMFNGTESNLHQTWDQLIIYAMVPFPPSGPSPLALDPYFAKLVNRIQSDSFRSPRSTWTMCDLDARRGTYCPEQWAKDSNAIVCDYAYGKYANGTGYDLWLSADKYAYGAFPIIEEQMAKAAWRLSGWLNALTDRVMGGPQPVSGQDSLSFRVQRGQSQLHAEEADVLGWEL